MADIRNKADSGKKQAPAKKGQDKAKDVATKTTPPAPPFDEDEEDGDIATPKHDHTGTDDEPL